MKHIPGPWKVQWNETTNRATIKKESDKRSVCSITPNHWDAGNADLIAAAPELLYQLIKARDQLYTDAGEAIGSGRYHNIDMAILRATGNLNH